MSNADPDSQSPEPQSTDTGADSLGPETEPTKIPESFRDDSESFAETMISSNEDEEDRFSPSEDTFSAVQDLGLRLQTVPDHNVIGRMAH